MGPDGLDVQIPVTGQCFPNVDDPADVKYLFDHLRPLGWRCRTDEEDLEWEVHLLVVDFRMVAFDDSIDFELLDAIPNGAGGDIDLVGDLLGDPIPRIKLEFV